MTVDHEAWKRAISAMPEPVMMTDSPDCVGHSKPMPAPEQPSATDCETEGHAWEHFDHIHASCTKCGERMEYPF